MTTYMSTTIHVTYSSLIRKVLTCILLHFRLLVVDTLFSQSFSKPNFRTYALRKACLVSFTSYLTLVLSPGIAVESRTLREFLCAANAPVMAQMVAAKRPRPATSTLAFMVFEEEDRATQTLVNLLEEYGWRLVCPVFDAVVAVPGPDAVPGTDQAVAQAFHAATGLQLQLKNIS